MSNIEIDNPDKNQSHRVQSAGIPKVREFMEPGISFRPGMSLRQVLRSHDEEITGIAWSPNGRYLASISWDKKIRIWDSSQNEFTHILEGHRGVLFNISWSPDSQKLVVASARELYVWDIDSKRPINKIRKHQGGVYSVAWSPKGNQIASGGVNDDIINISDDSGEIIFESSHLGEIHCIGWSPDGHTIAVGCNWGIWIGGFKKKALKFPIDHDIIQTISWSPSGELIIAGSHNKRIYTIDVAKGTITNIVEAHTDKVISVCFSHDGRVLASKSIDNTVQLWDTNNWGKILSFHEVVSSKFSLETNIAFHPKLPILATLGKKDTVIRIWDIDIDVALSNMKSETIRYTTAKLVLVGDPGVGKTGLGWRLAHGEFKEHESTHGQQFWIIHDLNTRRDDGAECEAVLWDLAGQHIYRSIHSIFLDNVNASLILFDPSNRDDPLRGTQFWLEQLKGKKQLPPSVLIGARVDRGAPVLSQQELAQFCQRFNISGGYISTSAKSGEGLEKLIKILKSEIEWDRIPATVTTLTFKRIKEYILKVKEIPDRKSVLIRPAEFLNQLNSMTSDWEFNEAELATVLGHLENHGYVTILYSSSGDQFVLLAPDLLVSVASSIFLLADKHPRDLGSISETDLLQGKFPLQELNGLGKDEQQTLLDAALVRFISHAICFREALGMDPLLIFPSLIKQRRPLQDEFIILDDVSYIVRGHVENIYSILVVLLGYTSSFRRINQWKNQAQYEMSEGEICGFRLSDEREGEIELVLYYSSTVPAFGRKLFQGLFESFLYKQDVDVTRIPPIFCPNKHMIERAAVIKRIRDGKTIIFCDECGVKTTISEIEKKETLETRHVKNIQQTGAIARLRGLYETHLTRIKAFRRDRIMPRCYVSHAVTSLEWATNLIRDLRDAGILIVEDLSLLEKTDFVIQICTPEYKHIWEKSNGYLSVDVKSINAHIEAGGPRIIILRLGTTKESVPRELGGLKFGDFRDDSFYAGSLFDLVLSLYMIPLNHPAFESLRSTLWKQWTETLDKKQTSRYQVYISYAWGKENEIIVDELDQSFREKGISIIRDKRDLGFKGRIKEFMETLGQGKAVILVISEKYLKSPNCCFELVEIAKHDKFVDRIFPIVLPDANIYNPVARGRYVKHWEKEKDELEDFMKEVSAVNMVGFREDIDLYAEIRSLLPKLMDILKDMNTLTPDLHRKSDFSEIFNAVMEKLDE